jgi:A/G-specific adenine glycosylase
MDKKNPREWYYALMDYGVYLAKQVENPNRKSKHYTIQSPLKGSNREVRGAILKELIEHQTLNMKQIYNLPFTKQRIDTALHSLHREGFVMEKKGKYLIK